jgi:hypothetical protein
MYSHMVISTANFTKHLIGKNLNNTAPEVRVNLPNKNYVRKIQQLRYSYVWTLNLVIDPPN